MAGSHHVTQGTPPIRTRFCSGTYAQDREPRGDTLNIFQARCRAAAAIFWAVSVGDLRYAALLTRQDARTLSSRSAYAHCKTGERLQVYRRSRIGVPLREAKHRAHQSGDTSQRISRLWQPSFPCVVVCARKSNSMNESCPPSERPQSQGTAPHATRGCSNLNNRRYPWVLVRVTTGVIVVGVKEDTQTCHKRPKHTSCTITRAPNKHGKTPLKLAACPKTEPGVVGSAVYLSEAPK